MDTFFQILLLLGILILGALGTYLFIKSQAHRKNLRAFASSANLSIYYKNKRSYKLEGTFKKYPFVIEPHFLTENDKKLPAWTHIQVPMVNPNRKYIWIARGIQSLDGLTAFQAEKSVRVKHEIAPDIEIKASDLFFSGILLSDQVKARISLLFGMTDALLVYLKGETLGVLLPQGPENQDHWKETAESMQLLVEIKDELNR